MAQAGKSGSWCSSLTPSNRQISLTGSGAGLRQYVTVVRKLTSDRSQKGIMKKNILILVIVTTGFFSCKNSNKSTPNIVATEISGLTKNAQNKKVFNDKDIYTVYKYIDSDGKKFIIQNGFPRGGSKYTDKNGDDYNYAVFWTQIINETGNPIELKLDIPSDSYKVPSLPGKYYKVLIPADTMTVDKYPLFLYGLTNLESYLDSNIYKSASLKRTIYPKQSNAFYVVILCLTEGAHGTMRTELSLKGQDIVYRINIDGSKSNNISSNMEIRCGSINLKNLTLQD